MRRRYQRGSLKDGGDRWELRWREYYFDPATGEEKAKQRQELLPKKGCPTKRLAAKALEERLREINHEDYKPVSLETFEGFAKRWQETVTIHMKPSAQSTCKSHIRVHLCVFDKWLLKDITTVVLQQWISSQKLESKTVLNILDTMRSMMNTARKWGYIRHKPFEDLILPKKEKPNTYAFSLQETLDIINAAPEPWKTLIRIVAESGVRSGEVAGLRIEDFDPQRLTLTVNQSVWNKKIQTPKTKNAVRREPISASLADAVQAHILTSKPNAYGLIFTGQTGQPLQMIHFLNRVFRPILKRLGIREKLDALGIKQCGLHALRRMNATEMDDQNVPMVTRQARLGHAHPSTTLYHYTKPIDQASRNFADRMGVMLAPVTDEEVKQ